MTKLHTIITLISLLLATSIVLPIVWYIRSAERNLSCSSIVLNVNEELIQQLLEDRHLWIKLE